MLFQYTASLRKKLCPKGNFSNLFRKMLSFIMLFIGQFCYEHKVYLCRSVQYINMPPTTGSVLFISGEGVIWQRFVFQNIANYLGHFSFIIFLMIALTVLVSQLEDKHFKEGYDISYVHWKDNSIPSFLDPFS